MSEQVSQVGGRSGWTGWAAFAAVMMLLAGVFQGALGIVAIFENEFFIVTGSQLYFLDISAWGWVHLVLGIALIFAAFSLSRGGFFGRFMGITLAILSAIGAAASFSLNPIWASAVILVDAFILYALIARGHELSQ